MSEVGVSVGWFVLYYASIMGVCKVKDLTGSGKCGAAFSISNCVGQGRSVTNVSIPAIKTL
jgi:hypothetical protein